MNRRHFLSSVVGTSLASHALALKTSTGSQKKGWCGSPKDNPFGAHWYYNWMVNPKQRAGLEYVPMTKGASGLNQINKIKQMKNISHILGFNEPERKKQGNLSVDQAIRLWPKLAKLAKDKNLRLGSPACSGASGMTWMKSFMKKAKDKGLHMDFVTVHYYNPSASGLEKLVKQFADDYDLPVWVTEFNAWSGDEKTNYKFLKESLRFLEKSKEVERYAYYSFGPNAAQRLFKKDDNGKAILNRMGALYHDAGT